MIIGTFQSRDIVDIEGPEGGDIMQTSHPGAAYCPSDPTNSQTAHPRRGVGLTAAICVATRCLSKRGCCLLGVGLTMSPLLGTAWAEIENELPPTVILAERVIGPSGRGTIWEADDISRFSPRSVDELLAGDPSFSLFRRQNALFSNPTSSGVSLRNTGASAASRTLVLRDGIPQNDPFGSWVSWTRYGPSTLASARIMSASESAMWGNMSPAGSIQLRSREIDEDRITLRAIVGSQASYGGSVMVDEISDDGELAASIFLYSQKSDGFYALKSSQRGLIDRKLDLEYQGVDVRFAWKPDADFTLESTLSLYEEERGNGTVLSRNESRALDLSLRATYLQPERMTQILGYYQRREFSSLFSAASADRNAERVALDQFDVPGEGYGGAIVQRRELCQNLEITMGVDFRRLDGETRENAGTFRSRRAGGKQAFVGIFGQTRWELGPDTRLDTSLRLDHWSFSDGFRREEAISSGNVLRSDDYSDRSDIEPSVSLSLEHTWDEAAKSWFSIGTSFRAPSINELYRPFRVRNDIVEANSDLDPERFFTLEAGVAWQRDEVIQVSASIYQHWIQDAIANVPVTDAAEISRIFGTLPAGGSGAQRQNVHRASVLGLRTSVEYSPDPRWSLRLDGQWSRSEFTSSPDQPLIDGESFPQSSQLRLTSMVTARPLDDWSLFLGVEYVSSAFDDLLGQRELPSYWTCRLGARWQINESVSMSARVENLFDEEIPTGLSSNGLLSVGQPRAVWLGAEFSF